MKSIEKTSIVLRQRGHGFLLAVMTLMIAASPFLFPDQTFSWLMDVILVVLLLAAARTVSGSGPGFVLTMMLGLVVLVSQFAFLIPRWEWLVTTRYVFTALFLFWVCALLLYDIILRSHTVTLNLIFGSVNVYLMVGLGFAFVFALIENLEPGSFTGLESFASTPDQVLQFLYFSYITMSTLGYGDISPLTPHGMTASYVEAIFGQLYLAILVARLVSLYIGIQKSEEN
jgi:hypothetical protein